MIKKNIFVSLILLTTILSGCASTAIDTFTQEDNYDSLYLRGVFTWWEADEKYKLVEKSEQVYSTSIELIADGQPYDFKFADAEWTPGLNCGFYRKKDQVIILGKAVSTNCESTDENFRFTPKETGTFEFTIDFSGFGSPDVIVNKL
ncbi:hypothetical protein RS130_04925 [Paraglaciecola aquimarina]|uniref:Pullulanase n=1 Tax=Paraglaciecola aquimarina TaxID=1235557 RepID=A0ABU3STM8_9ALTE|nr:hypothetical protein [Paraglaciecola aquimarina]MDU0353361.1 hypothetical protein [Paraglaciecola aquimarina]